MNLIENEELNEKKKKSKTIMIIIISIIAVLLILSVVLLFMIFSIQKNTLKLNIDNKSTNFASDMFIQEGDKLYIAIKDFATLMGYQAYNGDYKTRYSEDTTNCYISNINEVASYSLNSATIYKKTALNTDYEYFELDEPVKLVNGKLYVLSDGMEKGTNSLIEYDSDNNQITVLSLDYIVNYYAGKFANSAVADKDAEVDFNNKKAILYDLIVVKNTDGHYGVVNSKGEEIIGAKYKSISFKEDSQEFTVVTDEGKKGILTADGTTKIEPNYDEIKKISQELNYYLVTNNKKQGIINQNGNTVIFLEYDQIGIDETKFTKNGIDNPYILFEKCIPVQRDKKWGLFDINGKQIIPAEYDEIGCTNGTQTGISSNNAVVIPEYEAIIFGREGKYTILSSSGETYVPLILNSVYSITTSGEEKYYMTFTRTVEQDGKKVDKQETYEIEQYFNEHIIQKPQEPQLDANTITNTQSDSQVNVPNDNQANAQNNNQVNTPANQQPSNQVNTINNNQANNQNNVQVIN